MDRITVPVAQQLGLLFDSDSLISFSISKNMTWTPVLPQLERPVGIDDAVIKLWANSWRMRPFSSLMMPCILLTCHTYMPTIGNCRKLRRLGLSNNALSDVAAKILSSE
jgi:hypothetical protein